MRSTWQRRPGPDRLDGVDEAFVDLYWIPLGAGGWFVRRNGALFEAIAAARAHRPRLELYHSALIVGLPDERYAIESAPASRRMGAERGPVPEGPVGSRRLGRLRVFRYELRCRPDGVIPDLAEAVESPQRLTTDRTAARRVVDLVPAAPTPVWGRDELGAGEMWNSNAFVSWLIVTAGLDVEAIALPAGGRAPGWDAGIRVARRRPPSATRDENERVTD